MDILTGSVTIAPPWLEAVRSWPRRGPGRYLLSPVKPHAQPPRLPGSSEALGFLHAAARAELAGFPSAAPGGVIVRQRNQPLVASGGVGFKHTRAPLPWRSIID